VTIYSICKSSRVTKKHSIIPSSKKKKSLSPKEFAWPWSSSKGLVASTWRLFPLGLSTASTRFVGLSRSSLLSEEWWGGLRALWRKTKSIEDTISHVGAQLLTPWGSRDPTSFYSTEASYLMCSHFTKFFGLQSVVLEGIELSIKENSFAIIQPP